MTSSSLISQGSTSKKTPMIPKSANLARTEFCSIDSSAHDSKGRWKAGTQTLNCLALPRLIRPAFVFAYWLKNASRLPCRVRESFLSKSHLIRTGATTTRHAEGECTWSVHTPAPLALVESGLLDLRPSADLRPALHFQLLAQPQCLHDLVGPLRLVFPHPLERGDRLDRDPVSRFWVVSA